MQRRSIAVHLTILTLLALAWGWWTRHRSFALHDFHHPGSYVLVDEGIVATPPALVLQGKRPYRDFVSGYPPTATLLYAVTYAVCGVKAVWTHYWNWFAWVVTLWCVYLLGRRAGLGAPPRLCAAAACLLWGPAHYNVAVPRYLAVATISVGLLLLEAGYRKGDLARAALAGACCGLAFLFSQNTGAAGFLAVAVSSLLLAAPRTWAEGFGFYAAGVGSVVALCLALGAHASRPTSLAVVVLPLTALLTLRACTAVLRDDLHRRAPWYWAITLGGFCAAVLVGGVGLGGWVGFGALWRHGVLDALQYGEGYHLPAPSLPVGFAASLVVIAAHLLLPYRWRKPALAHPAIPVLLALVLATTPLWSGPLVWESAPTSARLWRAADWLSHESLLQLSWCLHLLGPLWWFRRQRFWSSQQAIARAIVLAWALTGALHLHPWADATHWIWMAPADILLLAIVIEDSVLGSPNERASPPYPASVVALCWSLLPLTYALAMAIRISTYFWEVPNPADLTSARRRPFAVLGPERVGLEVDAEEAQALARLQAAVDARAPRDEPVLALMSNPLLYLLLDRPVPVATIAPRPGALSGAPPPADVLACVRESRVRWIALTWSDPTVYGAPVMRAAWPTLWHALQANYVQRAAFGRYRLWEARQHTPEQRNVPGPLSR